MTETWRLLITGPLSGALNMAIDRWLLAHCIAGGPPTLRFYQWSPACLSIGIGQRLRRDVNLSACRARGIDVVRRQTGGRAILHDQELTYAVTLPPSHALSLATLHESYRMLSNALNAGLRELGVNAAPAPESPQRQPVTAACYDLAGSHELKLDDRKLVGSAQARQHGAVLQHGSLLLHADAQAIADVLHLPPEMNATQLQQRMAALDEVMPLPPIERIVAALAGGFQATLGLSLEPFELDAHDWHEVQAIANDVFANPAWTERR